MLTLVTLLRLGSNTSNEVQIAGDATKWLLRLRDGRSLVLPMVCPCGSGVMLGVNEMGQVLVMTERGGDYSKGWCNSESVVDSMIEDMDPTSGVDRLQISRSGEQ